MGEVISIVNRKGGVGKTTLSIALAETFVFEHRKNVVILDLDPQSSASETLLSEAHYSDCVESYKSFSGYVAGSINGGVRAPFDACVQRGLHSFFDRGDCELALLPNCPDLWDLEWNVLRSQNEQGYRDAVVAVLDLAKQAFDYVIIDCPPGRTISAEAALLRSDLILCPVVPERLSVWGMDRMKAYFEELSALHPIPNWRFVISRAILNTREGQRQTEDIKRRYEDKLLRDSGGMFHIGSPDFLRVPRSEMIVQRIAKFRDSPDEIRTLDQFYGSEVSSQLKRIAKVALKDLRRNG